MLCWNFCRAKAGEEAAIHKTFTTRTEVYWFDCDPAGIVYYGNFFKFFEIAEEELFASLGVKRAQIIAQSKFSFPRVETWARFRKPAAHGDILAITVWIEKRTEKSLLYCFEIRQDGKSEVIIEGSYWVVCLKPPEMRAIPMPAEVLELLGDYLPPISARSREHRERHPYRDIAP